MRYRPAKAMPAFLDGKRITPAQRVVMAALLRRERPVPPCDLLALLPAAHRAANSGVIATYISQLRPRLRAHDIGILHSSDGYFLTPAGRERLAALVKAQRVAT